MTQQFPSKRDTWLTVVILTSVAALVLAAGLSAYHGQGFVAGAMTLSGAAILWIFFGTRYTVTDSALVIRAGPFRWRIALASITGVEPTDDPRSSPANSLDRLEIRYGDNKRILVSPQDQQAFLAALKRTS